MSNVTVTVKAIDTEFDETIADYSITYGTGSYKTAPIVDDGEFFIEHCVATNIEFVKVDNMETGEIVVHVVKGDLEVIGDLVKKEIEHFDEEVELVIV